MRVADCILSLGIAAVLGSAAAAQDFDTEGLAPEIAALADLTVQRCASCHVLRRVVQARHQGDEWAPVVEKMRKKEKAGISAAEAAEITRFLAAWSTRGSPSSAPSPAPAPDTAAVLLRGAVAASAAITEEVPLPKDVVLGPERIRILSIEASEEGIVTTRIETAGGSHEIRHGIRGGPVNQSATVRSWTIGPHRFRLAVESGSPSDTEATGPRPPIVLELRVHRE